MRLDPLRSFSRDIDAIPDAKLRQRLKLVLLAIEAAGNIQQVPHVKKMKGHSKAFRIRVGDFRLGVFVEGDTVQLVRFLHRREVYRWFP
ncbi:MAG: plasmid stabilization protein [Flavobacteriales bacterium]|nr:plasmid stabilization protein [Flavobacteriales bacterium]